jgi:hypothetical protein
MKPEPFGEQLPQTNAQRRAINDVRFERQRQDSKWGEQNHDDLYWLGILTEEVGETAKAIIEDRIPSVVKEELVHVTAVGLAWLECMERRAQATGRRREGDDMDTVDRLLQERILMRKYQKVRDALACQRLDDALHRAPLAVILCEHFACLSDCPDDGGVDDNGWHPWASEQCDRMLDQLAKAAVEALTADAGKETPCMKHE